MLGGKKRCFEFPWTSFSVKQISQKQTEIKTGSVGGEVTLLKITCAAEVSEPEIKRQEPK